MRKPRVLYVDTYYPQVLEEIERRPGASYRETLEKLLALRFGTADFASGAMRRIGWDAEDVVVNCRSLARAFATTGRGELSDEEFALSKIRAYDADAVAVQNVSILSREALAAMRNEGRALALYSSYQMAADAPLEGYDVLFTSFPHYQELLGKRVRVVVLPLAFGMEATADLGQPVRDLPVTFVGGCGHPLIWRRGQDAFELLARKVPEFRWWGYGESSLPKGSPLRTAWSGQAWGLDMYRIYLKSKIVVNRHGEIASGYANNMRLYEATGSGALLVTERAPNLGDLFRDGEEVATYTSPEDLVETVRRYLADEPRRAAVAAAGQAATLSRHTFYERAAIVDQVLRPAVLSRRSL
jgi:hypothetical protein